ncbi:MAG: recombination regulator RecX [Alteromonadaceae bacterium]|nr:recombination regulator RecX [Alteromonadaceae bacterium]
MNTNVLHSAINYLSRREHSANELVDKLRAKEYSLSDITPVIEHLQQNNYQSDQRYAECIVRHRVTKGYGWQYIKQALKQKGVCESIINQEYKNQQIDWYLQAELAYNKRFGDSEIKDKKDKAKRLRFMQSRGFSFEQILALIK